MTETLTTEETQPAGLGAKLTQWVESPPDSLSAALAADGVSPEQLEEYARSGISTEEVETLRKVLVQGAASGVPEDAALLARLTPLLDPRERAWDRVLKAKSSGEVLNAIVTEAVKGGLVVDLGVRGFVPSSQIGLSVPRNLTQYVGQTLKLRVMEVDRRRQTVILTNRQVMEEERATKRRAALGRLQDGEVRRGIVRRLTDIGAFVDVGGVDGLLHVSEISWKRVEHPSDVLKVGQKIQVKVLRVDPDAGRISLSMRQLMTDPWEEARKKYTPGNIVKVKVASIVPQGAVIEMEEGLDGFLPVSELASRRVTGPEEVVQVGQEVDALVIDLRPRERKIVFSLRKMEQKRERQVVESYQRKTQRSDRTTLGDLFGHLFEEYQPEPEEPPTPAPAAVESAPPAEASGTAAAAVEEVTAVPEAEAGETAIGDATAESAVETGDEDAVGEPVAAVENEVEAGEVEAGEAAVGAADTGIEDAVGVDTSSAEDADEVGTPDEASPAAVGATEAGEAENAAASVGDEEAAVPAEAGSRKDDQAA